MSPKELNDVVRKRQQDTLDRAKFLGGDPEGKIGNSAEFRDIYEITKASRAWLVVDPPDGRIPPLTPQAQARRIAAQARGGSSFGNGPFDGPEDFRLYDRCITRGFPGSMLPGACGNSFQIMQGPGFVAIRYEMIHETRVIPLDRRPHTGTGIRLDMGDARGRWEGDTLVVETTNFRAERVPQRQRRHVAADRANHAHRAGPRAVVGHRRRSVDLEASLDLCHPADCE